jgi:hypothetical protein
MSIWPAALRFQERRYPMSGRMSFVGGVLSFSLVILLSWLSLDTAEGGRFFMQGIMGSDAGAVIEVGPASDSVKGPCFEEPIG